MAEIGMYSNLIRIFGIAVMLSMLSACGDTGKARQMMEGAIAAQPEEKKIIEFFMYTCPHCKNMEPTVNSWQAKQSILFQQGIYTFEQIPAIFSANWGSDSKNGEREAIIYYTLRRMGLELSLRAHVFAAIQDKSLDASDPQSIAAFLAKEGIPAQEFNSTMKSAEVKADVGRAEQMTRQYGVYSVPVFILFNRSIIMAQDYADNNAVEAALLSTVKQHYTQAGAK